MAERVKVEEVMTTSIRSVQDEESVRNAATLMVKYEIGSLIVVKERKPVGILTDGDVLRKVVAKGFDPDLIKVKDVMSAPVITIDHDADIAEATRIIKEKKIQKLAVVRDGELVGIVSINDILKRGAEFVEEKKGMGWGNIFEAWNAFH